MLLTQLGSIWTLFTGVVLIVSASVVLLADRTYRTTCYDKLPWIWRLPQSCWILIGVGLFLSVRAILQLME